ncbi:UNKNOWN [Stylonychia lemnae]|uniref:Uncharacterized protein n=1 Tax=Stylonychia lemnae TaxID=5949 RepID=A0A077ZWS3_STYLE|nr:UNKNOWN [Stylonychia lemnae]|eukprot:CDW74294.1 UNKNOWN [Stylonychia lemnae]
MALNNATVESIDILGQTRNFNKILYDPHKNVSIDSRSFGMLVFQNFVSLSAENTHNYYLNFGEEKVKAFSGAIGTYSNTQCICLTDYDNYLVVYVIDSIATDPSLDQIAKKLKFKYINKYGDQLTKMNEPYCTDISMDPYSIVIYGFSDNSQNAFRITTNRFSLGYSISRFNFDSVGNTPVQFRSHFARNYGYKYFVFGYATEFIDCTYRLKNS